MYGTKELSRTEAIIKVVSGAVLIGGSLIISWIGGKNLAEGLIGQEIVDDEIEID